MPTSVVTQTERPQTDRSIRKRIRLSSTPQLQNRLSFCLAPQARYQSSLGHRPRNKIAPYKRCKRDSAPIHLAMNRAFSAGIFGFANPAALPQAFNEGCAVGALLESPTTPGSQTFVAASLCEAWRHHVGQRTMSVAHRATATNLLKFKNDFSAALTLRGVRDGGFDFAKRISFFDFCL